MPGDVPFIKLRKAISMAALEPNMVGSWGVIVFKNLILMPISGREENLPFRRFSSRDVYPKADRISGRKPVRTVCCYRRLIQFPIAMR